MFSINFSLVVFCVTTSISPGPASLLVMMAGATFGMRQALPIFGGILIGFGLMVLLSGLGLGNLFHTYPLLHSVIKYTGIAYLLYLAYGIMRFQPAGHGEQQPLQPISLMQAALLQWVNPKGWLMAIGAVASSHFTIDNSWLQALMLTVVFLLIRTPCIGLWLLAGVMIGKYLSSPSKMRVFNYVSGILLVISSIMLLY